MIKFVRPLLFLSIGLYVASLTQIAFCFNEVDVRCMVGAQALVDGAFGWFLSFVSWPWLANFPLFFGWLFLWLRSSRWMAFSWSVGSLLIAFSFLWVENHFAGWSGGRIVSRGTGYWLWLASMAVAVVASILLWSGSRAASYQRET